MATLYANSAGAWASAIWYDVATGQPYVNTYPQDDDDVYLNGYTITLPSINPSVISAKTIHNGLCEATGGRGGALTGGYNAGNIIKREINANIIVDGNSPMLIGGNGAETTINGNVTMYNGDLQNSNANYRRLMTVNGNVEVYNGLLTGNGTTTLTNVTINGNAIFHTNPLPTNINEFYCYQNLTIEVNITPNYAFISYLHAKNSKVIVTDIEIGNAIDYDLAVTDYRCGIEWTNLFIISNLNLFTWKDVSNPRVNPFIIVTNADMNNHQQYPPENAVKQGVEYVWGEKVGTYLPDYPPESVVLQGYEYDNGDKVGNMAMAAQVGCVTKEDVRDGVPLLGMGENGTLVVPSADDVRESVVFDNGSVGTLIVQGGGDRLRIADFGYYTNAQSDTYIVDLTEQDKPKFAVAEERVLIEMFPDLDLENIPDKYFDDLFVKYLKYRLIVEYYRTAGINSTFTPSEPTTEIVNYQNVRNEVWLNSANIYLKAWAKKYPESIAIPQRILL